MDAGPELVLVSLHQRDASLDVRERFAAALAGLTGPDVLVVGTCHRLEVVVALPAAADRPAALRSRLGVAPPPAATLRDGEAAIRQLVRVAAGLDSVIRGEAQILGQLRRSHDAARAGGPLDPLLALVVRRVLEAGRRLRRESSLGGVRRTLGSLAVDAALADLADPGRASVLIVGAGEIGKLALRALASRVGAVVIANRDLARASALAAEHGATAAPLDRLDALLAGAGAVIGAADTRGAVLTAERLGRRLQQGPFTLVDLAVPRSVAPAARTLAGLRYVDVDDLAADATPELSAEELAGLEARCAVAAAAIARELRERAAAPAIRALHERAEGIRRRQLDRALARLGHLSARDRAVVEALSEGLAHALLHEPTVRLREVPERAALARELFRL